MLPFKDGAFRLAVEAGVPILPIAVAGTRHCMAKSSLLFRRARAKARVLAPIPTEGMTSADVTLTDAALRQPGSFRLSYMLEGAGVTASLMAYPDPEIGGGYFLLLAGVPAEADQQKAEQLKREIMIVLDRSGSMRGEKIEQARAAAVAILEGLENGEAFNVVDYSDTIAMFGVAWGA
jgi:hypothetical protein